MCKTCGWGLVKGAGSRKINSIWKKIKARNSTLPITSSLGLFNITVDCIKAWSGFGATWGGHLTRHLSMQQVSWTLRKKGTSLHALPVSKHRRRHFLEAQARAPVMPMSQWCQQHHNANVCVTDGVGSSVWNRAKDSFRSYLTSSRLVQKVLQLC